MLFEIQVHGRLSQAWADCLGDVVISASGENELAVTTLTGHALDRAALMGLLNSLYDLGLTLVSVACQPVPGNEMT
jgi:hypothetical protein